MASDGTRTEPYETSCISLSLNGTDADKITAAFEKLSAGGKVTNPMKVESWGDTFGELTDKFGIDWMVNISAA
jgi:PhnB protein